MVQLEFLNSGANNEVLKKFLLLHLVIEYVFAKIEFNYTIIQRSLTLLIKANKFITRSKQTMK